MDWTRVGALGKIHHGKGVLCFLGSLAKLLTARDKGKSTRRQLVVEENGGLMGG